VERSTQLLLILLVEAAIGYPQWLFRAIRHPVVWMGSLITALEARWNRGDERRRLFAGCALMFVLLIGVVAVGVLLEWMSHAWQLALAALVLIGSTMLAQRSLYTHVAAVLTPLASGDLAGARLAVSRIVGRDTASLDSAGVSTAAIESLSESFCDGIVAPAFWFLVAGLPGLLACKAINTADSMIGHKDERYRAFGWAAARTDDLVNFIPARLAGLLICAVGPGGLITMFRDARRHASPNGGWPEAAMAGVLACQLGGPVSYDGESAYRALLGNGPRPDVESLRVALRVFGRACLALWLIVGAIAWLQ
jgi:adenosylcobinamide-phosphate synthase